MDIDFAGLALVGILVLFLVTRKRSDEKFLLEKQAIRSLFHKRTLSKEYVIETLSKVYDKGRLIKAFNNLHVRGELKSAGINLAGQDMYRI